MKRIPIEYINELIMRNLNLQVNLKNAFTSSLEVVIKNRTANQCSNQNLVSDESRPI